jgi:mono/diheme cytochrome c family protein
VASTVVAEATANAVIVEEQGRLLFEQICATCHGIHGEGRANDLKAPPLNSHGKTAVYSDDRIVMIIRDGGRIMPAFGDQLNPSEIQAAVVYLRALSERAGP